MARIAIVLALALALAGLLAALALWGQLTEARQSFASQLGQLSDRVSALEARLDNATAALQRRLERLGEELNATRRALEARRPEIVVLRITWPIEDSSVARLVPYLVRLQQDEAVRGIVLYIYSPGGTVSATEALYTTLAGINKTKYAVIEGFGASGAYYTAMAAEKIYATPSAWVGSVGVIAVIPVEEYLIDLPDYIYTTGPLKYYGKDLLALYEDIEAARENFLAAVERGRAGRLRSVEAVETAAIFSAGEALQLGLIDAIGGLWDAVRDMAARLGLSNYTVVDLYQKYNISDFPYGFSGKLPLGRLLNSSASPLFYIYPGALEPPRLQLPYDGATPTGTIGPEAAGRPYVLLDMAHGNSLPLGFAEVLQAELAPRGYALRTVEGEYALISLLPNASGLIVVNPTVPFGQEALRAVAAAARRGLRILYMADSRAPAVSQYSGLIFLTPVFQRPEVHNLLALFNMSVLPRSVYNGSARGSSVTENWQFVNVASFPAHPLFRGLGRLALYAPTPVFTSAPVRLEVRGSVRGYGDGSYTVAAVSGNLTYVGTIRSFTPYFLSLADNRKFLQNLIEWLVAGGTG